VTNSGHLQLDPATSSGGNGGSLAFGVSHYFQSNEEHHEPRTSHPVSKLYQSLCYMVQLPFWCCCVNFMYGAIYLGFVVPVRERCAYWLRQQANSFLYGQEPYLCRMRLTLVNFVVLCGTWFIFMDQARLAFLPPSSDQTMAIMNLFVWTVLVLELLLEVFIRPDGYQSLLISDKAFAPSTVLHINVLHLCIEVLSLCFFIPEFLCIFTGESCSQRYPFSFYNAALISVIGPTFRDIFHGHLYMSLVRVRVFGMVRHWRNMWITRTFVDMTWRSQKEKILSNIIPPSVNRSTFLLRDRNVSKDRKENGRKNSKDAKLTNASNIGTALMTINSYRTFAIVCIVVGLFPIIFSLQSLLINSLTYSMTHQLQGTNLVASDTSNATCQYLDRSIEAWLEAVEALDNILTWDVRPLRCGYALGLSDSVSTMRTYAEIARENGIRIGSITELERSDVADLMLVQEDGSFIVLANTTYSIVTRFDQSRSIKLA
jgi:hypothetical protein